MLHVRPSTPDDALAIVALMRRMGLHPNPDPAYLYWKYWLPQEGWEGSRSFVVSDGQELFAHGAVVPGAILSATLRVRVLHLIDWVAGSEAGAAGLLLMQHVARRTDCMLGIGGSAQTVRILPLFGYRQCGQVTGYVRPISPFGIFCSKSKSRWRVIPRFARSVAWSLASPHDRAAGWCARRIDAAALSEIAQILPAGRPGLGVTERSTRLFDYAMACPIAQVEIFAIEEHGRMKGYFMLSLLSGQARLADAWVASENPSDWRALFGLAVRQAKAVGGLAEIVAWSSDEGYSRAIEACGFHKRITQPIFLRGRGAKQLAQGDIRVQMLDSDAYFLYSKENFLWA